MARSAGYCIADSRCFANEYRPTLRLGSMNRDEKEVTMSEQMSEHVWSQEQLVAYIACGLSAAEVERLESHARECPECASAIESYSKLDRGLNSLFDLERPGPGLDDRLLFALRMGPERTSTRLRDLERKPAREGWKKRIL